MTEPAEPGAAEGPPWRRPVVLLVFVMVTLLAGYDYAAGPEFVLIGLLSAGPCLAATAGSARAVVAVGAYVVLLSLALSWPDRLWWTRAQAAHIAGGLAITALSVAVARQVGALRRTRDAGERALRLSEEQHRRILETTSEGVVMTDVEGRVTYANRPWAELIDHPFEDVIGQRAGDLVNGLTPVDAVDEAVGRLVADMNRAAAGPDQAENRRRGAAEVRTGTRQNFRLRRRDGKEVFFATSITPLRDADGKPAGMLSMTTDISDQRRLEEQFRQAQKLDAVGQLAGGVAHDFNNLLTVIDGYAEMLTGSLPDADPHRHQAEQIRAAAGRAAAVTRQLLMFSSKQAVEPELLDLSEVAGNLQGMLDRLIREDVVLTCASAADGLWVWADRGQLEQVIVNLVVNARDAMPDGGSLMIETGMIELGERESLRSLHLGPGRYAMLSVSDTGEGMTPEIISHLFEPFFTTKAPGKGTGLGLSTVYGIVRQAGGQVAVYSEVGVGTTMKVSLPCVAGSVGDETAPRSEMGAGVARGHETILLVEDDDEVRALSTRMLCDAGYAVVPARNGDEALALGRSRRVDLLLTDVIMPGMNGVQLAERLRDHHPLLPVLFASGYSHGMVARFSSPGRIATHVDKPYTAVTLTQHVRAALAHPTPPPLGDADHVPMV